MTSEFKKYRNNIRSFLTTCPKLCYEISKIIKQNNLAKILKYILIPIVAKSTYPSGQFILILVYMIVHCIVQSKFI